MADKEGRAVRLFGETGQLHGHGHTDRVILLPRVGLWKDSFPEIALKTVQACASLSSQLRRRLFVV